MEYNAFLQKCNDDDVLELDNNMIKLSKLRSDLKLVSSFNQNSEALVAIAKYVKSTLLSKKDVEKLFNDDGVDANVLRIGSQGWKKGKIKLKIVLEFCPDEPEIEQVTQSNDLEMNQPESPLDDIRRMMNKDD
jgi:hypothetical protein